MRVVSSGGNVLFVTIIDSETKYKTFTLIRTKGKANQAVIATVNRWKTLTGLKFKVIRSDNGKEYEGTDFERWLSDKGIQHQTSMPYTPQQNGVAERYNRVITERTMALLADSGLPPKWWAEAGATVNYLANRVPQRNQLLTPYKLLHRVRPGVGHIRIFGCAAWVYTPPDIRTKLQPRAERGILLGYAENQKGYCALVKNKVEVSRDVRFDETVVGQQTLRGLSPAHATVQLPSVAVAPTPTTTVMYDGDFDSDIDGPDTPAPTTTVQQQSSSIDEAVAAARNLVNTGTSSGATAAAGGTTGEKETGASGAESDTSSGFETADDNDDNSGAATMDDGSLPSRHTARLPRANPKPATGRGNATAAWAANRPSILHDAHAGRRPMRLSAAATSGTHILGSALAAKGGRSPDKMRIDQARRQTDLPVFEKAVNTEVDALWAQGTWKLTILPHGKRISVTEMLCEHKRGPTEEVTLHKGRYVVRGNKQIFLLDYNDVWAPVAPLWLSMHADGLLRGDGAGHRAAGH
eukprot:contig_9357_g2238